jgi:hypothetical protein
MSPLETIEIVRSFGAGLALGESRVEATTCGIFGES